MGTKTSTLHIKVQGIFLLLVLLFTVSCSEESITPAFEPVTFNQQMNQRPFTVSFDIDEIQVDDFTRDFADVSVIGNTVQDLVGMLADMEIEESDGKEVPLEPTVIDVPYLNEADMEMISKLDLEKVSLKINGDEVEEGVSLDFIKSVEIFVTFDDAVLAKLKDDPMLKDEKFDAFENAVRILSYDKKKKKINKKCKNKCIDLMGEQLNWKKLIAGKTRAVVLTRFIVESAPRKDMKISAKISIKAKLDHRI